MPLLERILHGVELELRFRADQEIDGSRHVGGPLWVHQTNDFGGAVTAVRIYYTVNPHQVVRRWIDVVGQDIPSSLIGDW